ncbi:MAG: hypothetical protein A2057_06210 [Ignavibacteria bacterium GWA2_35_9]|nr:MAG: hypothetical protein A2057_06210 [Ignavibacteria bacterium GWA2_35_9]
MGMKKILFCCYEQIASTEQKEKRKEQVEFRRNRLFEGEKIRNKNLAPSERPVNILEIEIILLHPNQQLVKTNERRYNFNNRNSFSILNTS